MKFKINAGVDLETTTPGEMKGMLDGSQQAWFQEMAKGVKSFRFAISGTVTDGTFTITSGLSGPNQGTIWAVQRFSVDQLATGDVIRLYRSPASENTFLGQLTVDAPMYHPGQGGIIIKGGEMLDVTGDSLTTTAGSLTITGEAWELPEFMVWKLL